MSERINLVEKAIKHLEDAMHSIMLDEPPVFRITAQINYASYLLKASLDEKVQLLNDRLACPGEPGILGKPAS